MDTDTRIKLSVYRTTALTGRPPAAGAVARDLDLPEDETRAAFARLAARRLLVLEEDGERIRMAPPFSGVPTHHQVRSDGVDYFGNCAWDALGIPAALHRPAIVTSRCDQTSEPVRLEVGEHGPPASPWLFHCAVPAARWWNDIVFT
jgi:hypothetical protein